jgi:hypothetical protein
MPATPFDSAIWRSQFHDKTIATLFTDTAVLRAELLVMGTLALTQAKTGAIPEISAKAIQRAGMEVQIDPAALGPVTAQTGDPMAALVAQFQNEMKAPEHAKWVHHDGESNATRATGLSLRLKQVFAHFETLVTGRVAADLIALKPKTLLAFHSDTKTRVGLTAGLGLYDAGTTTPAAAIAPFAQWVSGAASQAAPQSDITKTLQISIPHFATLLDDRASPTMISLILPQLCLGLAVLLRAP